MIINPVKGTHDLFDDEALQFEYVNNILKEIAELYSFHEINVPILEYSNVFSRGTGESSDVVRKEMYTFLDKGNRQVSLRPEFTAGVMRSIISNKLYINDMPLKYYYSGPLFRYERPQLGRYRQFNQFGVECIGLDSYLIDSEVILLAMQSLTYLGFKNLKLKINCLGDDESRNNYKIALKEYFSKYLPEMCDDCKERFNLNPLRILDCKVPSDIELAKNAPKIKNYLSKESEERFYKTISLLNDFEIDYEIDDSLVRGLDYYSEIVFEIHGQNEQGVSYGALGGGGHYAHLVKDLGGPDLAGVGFAFGLERIVSLMRDLSLLAEIKSNLDLFLIPIGPKALEQIFNLTMYCRSLGYSADSVYSQTKLATCFKKAEKKNAKYALIIGDDELEQNTCQLKNLTTKKQFKVNLSDLELTLDKLFVDQNKEHND